MFKTIVATALVVAFFFMCAAVTPWLINQRSSLTLVAVPFAWLFFAFGAHFITTRFILKKGSNP